MYGSPSREFPIAPMLNPSGLVG